MDVRAFGSWTSAPKCLFFPGLREPDRSFCPRTSAGISAWTSAGYPAPKLTLWAAFLFLRFTPSRTKKQLKNLLIPLFLMGCFPVDFQEVKQPLGTKSAKRPIKVGKRPINEGKRPIKAMVLVGISVGCLMGCFRSPPPWRKTAPLKRPIKRSMNNRAPVIVSHRFRDYMGLGIT